MKNTNDNNMEYQEVGRRLKSLRALLGLSRAEFEKKYRISAATLRAWEDPPKERKQGLSVEGAKKIIAALNTEKIACSLDWLFYGIGNPPQSYKLLKENIITPISNTFEIPSDDFSEATSALKDVNSFLSNHVDSITLLIQDDSMEPQYEVGDYVGGILSQNKIDNLIGEICIITLPDNITLARRLEESSTKDTFTLIATNPKPNNSAPILFNVKIHSAAKLIWHRKL